MNKKLIVIEATAEPGEDGDASVSFREISTPQEFVQEILGFDYIQIVNELTKNPFFTTILERADFRRISDFKKLKESARYDPPFLFSTLEMLGVLRHKQISQN